MTDRVAVVVTSIAPPNAVLRALAVGCRAQGWDFVVIGDAKSPADFQLADCRYFDLAAQRGLGFALTPHCPTGHYARKNLGYLAAIRAGAARILETDDDNHPLDGFWHDRERRPVVPLVEHAGWVNAYRLFSDALLWPRGLPLDAVHEAPPVFERLVAAPCDCPIQQELADGNPDLDAIHRPRDAGVADIPLRAGPRGGAGARRLVPVQQPEHRVVARRIPTALSAGRLLVPHDRHLACADRPAHRLGERLAHPVPLADRAPGAQPA
ncbi:MAG: hypothetical protein WDO24_11545 [Pseudomonadota bacterium]